MKSTARTECCPSHLSRAIFHCSQMPLLVFSFNFDLKAFFCVRFQCWAPRISWKVSQGFEGGTAKRSPSEVACPPRIPLVSKNKGQQWREKERESTFLGLNGDASTVDGIPAGRYHRLLLRPRGVQGRPPNSISLTQRGQLVRFPFHFPSVTFGADAVPGICPLEQKAGKLGAPTTAEVGRCEAPPGPAPPTHPTRLSPGFAPGARGRSITRLVSQ